MDGRRIKGRASLLAEDGKTQMSVSAPWSMVGTGDFSKNGNADILFRNSSDNGMQSWFMNGPRITGRAPVVAEDGKTNMLVGPPWSIVGVGDFNKDGGADILWHNSSSNETQIWFMDGARISSRATVTSEDGRTPMLVALRGPLLEWAILTRMGEQISCGSIPPHGTPKSGSWTGAESAAEHRWCRRMAKHLCLLAHLGASLESAPTRCQPLGNR